MPASRVNYEDPGVAVLTKTTSYGDQSLFARPLSGGAERKILDSVVARAFFVVAGGLYHIARAGEKDSYTLEFHDLATGESRTLAKIDSPPDLGLTVSPNREIVLFSVLKQVDSDLMLIESFR